MGFFGSDYATPGPGISKNAPQKKGLARYFEILMRKFWKLMQANMLHIICSIPMIIVLFFISPVNDYKIIEIFTKSLPEAADKVILMPIFFRLFCALFLFTFIGSGPSAAGYAFLTRCFTREEHAWIFSDFVDKFSENIKQGFIVSLIDLLITSLGLYGIIFYFNRYTTTNQSVWLILLLVLLLLMSLFLTMHTFIYQLMVTFESSTLKLYKNAFIFASASLGMNIIYFIISFLGLSLIILNPVLGCLLYFLIGYSLLRFPMEYYAARQIDKKILSKMPKIEYDDDLTEGEE